MENSGSSLVECILNSTHDAIIAIDDHERIIVFNTAAERLSGKKTDEVIGKPVSEVIPNTRLNKVLESGIPEINQRQQLGDTFFSCD